jgi:5-methylcytosine-specific restriction endonuclease McrA
MIRQDRIRGKKRTLEEKLELFQSTEGLTIREVDVKLAQLQGRELKRKLVIELDSETENLWNELMAEFAHSTRGDASLCLKKLLWERKQQKKEKLGSAWLQRTVSGTKQLGADQSKAQDSSSSVREEPRPLDRSFKGQSQSIANKAHAHKATQKPITRALRGQILRRDHYQCTHCGSRYALQVDHIVPRARGGTNEVSNLRTLCRSCNLYQATQVFGVNKVRSKLAE